MDAMQEKYLLLVKRKIQLEEEATRVGKEAKELETPILEQMLAINQPNFAGHGLTISPRADTFVSKGEGVSIQDVCDVLKGIGMGDLVADHYYPQTLTSHVKNMLEEGGDLPDELSRVVNVTKAVKLVSRKRNDFDAETEPTHTASPD